MNMLPPQLNPIFERHYSKSHIEKQYYLYFQKWCSQETVLWYALNHQAVRTVLYCKVLLQSKLPYFVTSHNCHRNIKGSVCYMMFKKMMVSSKWNRTVHSRPQGFSGQLWLHLWKVGVLLILVQLQTLHEDLKRTVSVIFVWLNSLIFILKQSCNIQFAVILLQSITIQIQSLSAHVDRKL